jgi:hypothetical protein
MANLPLDLVTLPDVPIAHTCTNYHICNSDLINKEEVEEEQSREEEKYNLLFPVE